MNVRTPLLLFLCLLTTLPAFAEPSVITNPATNITQTSATLHGIVTANGATVDYQFAWGPASASRMLYETPLRRNSSGSTFQMAETLGRLSCGETIKFQAVIKWIRPLWQDEYRHGSVHTFSTVACDHAPVVTTGSATSITQTGATLSGTVDPGGQMTITYFEWSSDAKLGAFSQTPNQVVSASATTVPIPVASLTGLTCNVTYYFRAVARNDLGTGKGSINSFRTSACPLPPIVTTTTPSAIGPYEATLHGTLNPNGLASTGWFQWGRTSAYGSSSAEVAAGSNSSPSTISQRITGLQCAVTYHFRAAGKNSAGTTYGGDNTFMTSACPGGVPTVTTSAATGISATGATLNGSVNPNGVSTTWQFQWGSTTAYGNSTTLRSAAAGTSSISISDTLAGLTCGTTYYFRAVGGNSFGTVQGSDQTFMTSSCACNRARGDVNGNGVVTAFDAALVLQRVVGLTSSDSCETCAADYNANGSVTAYDAAQILACVVNPAACLSGSCQ